MNNRIIVSILMMILGLLVIFVPTFILPVCPPTEVISQSADGHNHSVAFKFMKCYWTAKAEIGVGGVIAVLGLVMLLAKSSLVRLGISMSLACIAVLVAAIPTILIGVCPGELMPCNIGTLPALLLLAGTIFIIAVLNSFYLCKQSNCCV